jgi:hypothetical protein
VIDAGIRKSTYIFLLITQSCVVRKQ